MRARLSSARVATGQSCDRVPSCGRAENQANALGTREAIIVLLEPDDGFFTPAK